MEPTCNVQLTGPLWKISLKLAIKSKGPKVASKDTCLSHGMASLMLHFKWTWIGLAITDDDEGIQFLSDLREEMQRVNNFIYLKSWNGPQEEHWSVTCTAGFRKIHWKGTADCCFDCVQCPENEFSNDTDMEQCVRCPDDSYVNLEQTQCLQRTVSFLAYEDPLGMFDQI
eukprot:XP_017455899.1 PREDICTED: vomeronasal type-2 receptor 116-like isoform X1 [Rattus norvegicus]